MLRIARAIGLILIGSMLVPGSAPADDVPNTILYQGRLTDLSGRPFADSTPVSFSIYDSAEDGVIIWTETHDLVPDEFGLFTIELGLTRPLGESVVDGRKLFLGITIENNQEMSPRQLLTSVPYAVNAGSAQALAPTATISPFLIEGTAATLAGSQIFTGEIEFQGNVRITSGNILLGDSAVTDVGAMIHVEQAAGDDKTLQGIYSKVSNSSNGELVGLKGRAERDAGQIEGNVYGVYGAGISDGPSRFGLWGMGRAAIGGSQNGKSYGVRGEALDGTAAYGVYGTASRAETNWAGYFDGDVRITGTQADGAGRTRIDHPLDPENKYLIHSKVESPDMLTVYSGAVILDGNGKATVRLPDYFDSLNSDYRYQLTPIGAPAPNLHVAQRVANLTFEIGGGESGTEVSWMVTGIRRDAYARAHRLVTEVKKPANERGKLIHPKAFGQPAENGIDFDNGSRVARDK